MLADVALPLVHHSLATWDDVHPDIFQRMLLTGIAVDSPADAAAFHPRMFGNAEQAKKEFDRTGFNGQNPKNSSYREMSLKSAEYRRAGPGRSWQRCWWIDGSDLDAHRMMERILGQLEFRRTAG